MNDKFLAKIPQTKPYHLRHVVKSDGTTPAGSSGFAYLFARTHYGLTVSDATAVGRFWPAEYDEANNRYVVTGPGQQMKDGYIVETFEI